jgi:hypothetical protein
MKSFHRSEPVEAAKNPRDLNVLGRELLDRLDPCGFSLRQLMWYVLAVGLALMVGLQLPKILAVAYESWRLGREFDAVVYREPGFDLRIRGLAERGTMLASPGIYYRYEVREHGWFAAWRQVAQVRVDEEKPINREQFRRVSDGVYYFFNDRALGVSVYGGVNWRCMEVDDLVPIASGAANQFFHRIESIELDASGSGEVTLTAIDLKHDETVPFGNLRTSDFGETWTKE